jgi:spore maturation protein CgeB
MATVGYSPPTRIFEAAGAGACVITDLWAGIETFFEPGSEILVASSAEHIVGHLRGVDAGRARQIGNAMRARALRDHLYSLRAAQVDRILEDAGSDCEYRAKQAALTAGCQVLL